MKSRHSPTSLISFDTVAPPEPIPTKTSDESKFYRCDVFLARFLKRIWTAFVNTFKEFCAYSSIHGVRHLYNPVWYEKIIFNICIIGSIVACILIMRLVRYERLERPIILSYDEKSMTIKEIPFPAITVCPQVKASHRKFDCAGMQGLFVSRLIKDQNL